MHLYYLYFFSALTDISIIFQRLLSSLLSLQSKVLTAGRHKVIDAGTVGRPTQIFSGLSVGSGDLIIEYSGEV